ncbi:hypothetical protein Zm00014a_033233 [Zea mays]|uniref:Uncharacterized protein n=1 Tax=Zea mays TaxID=4577 RepID=A0A3L6DMW1_MAIZE|nr:hypothetical protein Zm00014a_033233 [Zea mays]
MDEVTRNNGTYKRISFGVCFLWTM